MSEPTNNTEGFDFGYKKPEAGFSNGAIPLNEQKPLPRNNYPQQASVLQPNVIQPGNYPMPKQRKKMGTGGILAIVLGSVGIAIVVPVIIFSVFVLNAFKDIDLSAPQPTSTAPAHDYLSSADYVWDKVNDPFTGQPYVQGNTGSGNVENPWKAGSTWLPAPAGEPQTENFTDEYVTPTDLLNNSGSNPQGVTAIFSSDPEVNCGMKNIRITDKTVAGCYNPAYGNVLIMYWGPDAPVDVRVLVLFHTYSHFASFWDNFDMMYTVYKSSDAEVDPSTVARVMEQDASCRVYFGWGNPDFQLYDRQLANPCGAVDDWDENWYYTQFFDAGLFPEDY